MNLKPLWEKAVSAWHTLAPDWQTFIRKSMPYILVAVFTSATAFAMVGVQAVGKEYMTIEGTKAELENEKQELAANQTELEKTLTETRDLLNRLSVANTNAKTLLDETENTVSDKIEELMSAYQNVADKEQQRWILPIQYTLLSSPFGYRDHPVAGEAKFHYGVDLAAPQGTPVVASRSGTVTKAAYVEDNEGYYVNIDHMDGYTSRYLHMSRFIVAEGQFVFAGQIIGYCGSTGVATGPHLHFGIYQDNAAVNPADYIDFY